MPHPCRIRAPSRPRRLARGAAIRYHAADFTADRAVDVDDLAVLLAAWGACEGDCPADFDSDGVVDTRDLAFVLANWGSRDPGSAPGRD